MTVQLCWECSYALPRACPLRLLSSVGTGVDPRWVKDKTICLPGHFLQSLFHACSSRINPCILCLLVQNCYIMQLCAGERKSLRGERTVPICYSHGTGFPPCSPCRPLPPFCCCKLPWAHRVGFWGKWAAHILYSQPGLPSMALNHSLP